MRIDAAQASDSGAATSALPPVLDESVLTALFTLVLAAFECGEAADARKLLAHLESAGLAVGELRALQHWALWRERHSGEALERLRLQLKASESAARHGSASRLAPVLLAWAQAEAGQIERAVERLMQLAPEHLCELGRDLHAELIERLLQAHGGAAAARALVADLLKLPAGAHV